MVSKFIGELLCEQRVLTPEQVELILARQKHCRKPFGVLAHEMFHVDLRELWGAWARQMASYFREVDLSLHAVDHRTARRISAGSAWRLRLLPLHTDDRVLIFATQRSTLADAVTFAQLRFDDAMEFVIAEPLQLEARILAHYGLRPRATDPAKHRKPSTA